MQKSISKTQNTYKNKKLVKIIKIGLIDLDKEIKKMSEDEIKIAEPDEI